MRELERRVLLSVLDRKWREHLYEMDYLREGIGLRAYSQRDPLVEYQREGFDMFRAMMDGIKEEAVGYLFNLEVQVEEEPEIDHTGHAHTLAEQGVEVGPGAARRPRRPRTAASTRRSAPRASTAPEAAAEPLLLGARRRTARPRSAARREPAADDPLRRRQPQRRVPVRLGQEVQEVPRRTRAGPPA